MTPTELHDALDRLDITQVEAARLLGVDARTVRRWLAGDRAVPDLAARLLAVAERVPGALEVLDQA